MVVEIKPAPDGHGFYLYRKDAPPIWFTLDHHALNYALDVYPTCEVAVYAADGCITGRYSPSVRE